LMRRQTLPHHDASAPWVAWATGAERLAGAIVPNPLGGGPFAAPSVGLSPKFPLSLTGPMLADAISVGNNRPTGSPGMSALWRAFQADELPILGRLPPDDSRAEHTHFRH